MLQVLVKIKNVHINFFPSGYNVIIIKMPAVHFCGFKWYLNESSSLYKKAMHGEMSPCGKWEMAVQPGK